MSNFPFPLPRPIVRGTGVVTPGPATAESAENKPADKPKSEDNASN